MKNIEFISYNLQLQYFKQFNFLFPQEQLTHRTVLDLHLQVLTKSARATLGTPSNSVHLICNRSCSTLRFRQMGTFPIRRRGTYRPHRRLKIESLSSAPIGADYYS